MDVPNVSQRQKDILRLIDEGGDKPRVDFVEEMAQQLDLSVWTVRDQVRRLAAIFQCRLPDLPARARERGVEF